MDTYGLMRHFADSWMLLFLTLFFLGVIFWVFRPGSSKEQRDSANIIFRHEDSPAEDSSELNPKEVRE
ncbi:CcoQ/FixQ family Cbb3-type cytochrome c oxidase assembly chaperone [Aliiruegeria sabulilitoris]|uniref:CcoQ/FixQ family Cbb3-type cytochrome c oxidase assembly chaperone n=1 Tax=Aliiruegeria sabulilitoris TaxID=1510458 RepID=UPI000833AAFF|nr:CcoQ/FixQ family Cbb3-type cytochrome c oxidase assembly chaperone [Aliiruegeria sabulilitoris]NDR57107.1 CcoQ/FixQ family Cbb3-type cytochrome c oxidase assembly chaperone [Pseudoruegeria sp. M32A2M]